MVQRTNRCLERDKQQLNAAIEQVVREKEQVIGANHQLNLKCHVAQSEKEQLVREKEQLVAQLAKARGTEGVKSVAETPGRGQ